jgi:hypothetical protein
MLEVSSIVSNAYSNPLDHAYRYACKIFYRDATVGIFSIHFQLFVCSLVISSFGLYVFSGMSTKNQGMLDPGI